MSIRRSSLFFLVVAWPAFGGWNDIKSSEFKMGPPPKQDSATYREDFETLHHWQETREQHDCDVATSQLFPTLNGMFGPKYGPLTKQEVKQVEPLLGKVMKYSLKVSSYFKAKYERARPYNTDPTIEPCIVKPPGNKSYPSGHATSATTSACVLSQIFPDKAKELEAYGEYLSDLRVIVGVHHPSDVKAAKKLGNDICERLLGEEDFQNELNPGIAP